MNEIKTVELTISSLLNDLNLGLTWLEKDNIGYGSIQAKYDATEMQIMVIKQHPKLIHVEPVRVFFTLRDDTVTIEHNLHSEEKLSDTTDNGLELGFMVPPVEEEIQIP